MDSSNKYSVFSQHGVIKLTKVFTDQSLSLLQSGISKSSDPNSQLGAFETFDGHPGKMYQSFFNWIENRDIKMFLFSDEYLRLVRLFTQSTQPRLFYDQIIVKEPQCHRRVAWHTDQDYFPTQNGGVISIWTCLDPVDRNSGAMGFLLGSHLNPISEIEKKSLPESTLKDSVPSTLPDFDFFADRYPIQYFDMLPGDCLVFDSRIFHFSTENNHATRFRRAHVSRWLTDDARALNKPHHLFNDPKISEFLQKHGHAWKGLLDDGLFPRATS